MITRHLFNTAAVLLLSPLMAAESGAAFVVSPRQVADAMGEAGKPVGADRIHLLSPVRTRRPNASLELVRVGEWQDGTLKAEMRCADRSVCLPFYVLVRDSLTEPLVVNQRPAQSQANFAAKPKTYDVRIGDPATLVFEREDSQIVMRVICVQNGDRGQRIRVATRDRRRFYEAEVVEPGFLRGTL
jgi:hypothetical protein